MPESLAIHSALMIVSERKKFVKFELSQMDRSYNFIPRIEFSWLRRTDAKVDILPLLGQNIVWWSFLWWSATGPNDASQWYWIEYHHDGMLEFRDTTKWQDFQEFCPEHQITGVSTWNNYSRSLWCALNHRKQNNSRTGAHCTSVNLKDWLSFYFLCGLEKELVDAIFIDTLYILHI